MKESMDYNKPKNQLIIEDVPLKQLKELKNNHE
jgi:hypothetical protein